MCRSAVNDGSCSPWVMCSCSVVSGNQIRDTAGLLVLNDYQTAAQTTQKRQFFQCTVSKFTRFIQSFN